MSVVGGEADDLEARHVTFLLEAFEFADEPFDAFYIGVVHVEAAVVGIEVTFQSGDFGAAGVAEFLGVGDKFAIAAIGDSGGAGAVPEIAAGGFGDGKEPSLG